MTRRRPDSHHPPVVGCVADLCVDLLVAGDVSPQFGQFEKLVDTYSLEAGGSGAIFASQFAKLGGAVTLIGGVGKDALGDVALAPLAAAGVPLAHVRRLPGTPTGLGLHLVKPDGDRATLTVLGALASPEPEVLTSSLLTGCTHWHLCSYFLLPSMRSAWRPWLRRCRESGLTASLDTNWDPDDAWLGVADLLPLVDVFLPNEAEAQAVARTSDTSTAGQRLSALGPLVAIKLGAAGAQAFENGRRVATYVRDPCEAPLRVVDTVGAGDSFDAGFLRAWLRGQPVEQCLELGARCAEATLSAPGGFTAQLREDTP